MSTIEVGTPIAERPIYKPRRKLLAATIDRHQRASNRLKARTHDGHLGVCAPPATKALHPACTGCTHHLTLSRTRLDALVLGLPR